MCSLSFGSFGRQSIWICLRFSSTLIIIQTVHLVNISMSYNLMNWMELLLQIHILEKKRSSVDRTEVLAVWEGCIIFNLITTYSYKRTVKQFWIFRLQPMYFYPLFIKAYVLGTHLNCLDKSRQFKWVPTKYDSIKKIRKISHKHH